MIEYREILQVLAQNPPLSASEKKTHALLLELLAKKLRGETAVVQGKTLKEASKSLDNLKKYH